MAAVIIEIFSRGRGQPQFRRVRQFPYRIGRAYDNDLILTDDSVSAHHLQLEQDRSGNLLLRNLSHENGTVLQKRKLGYAPEPIALPADIHVGHSHLRFVHPDSAVAPAKRVQHTPGMSWFLNLPVALCLLFTVLLLNTWLVFHEQIEQQPWYEVLTGQLAEILSPLILATITGFISRVLLHRWQYPLHLSIACVAILSARAGAELSAFGSYYFSDTTVALLLNNAIAATVYAGLFAWQLRAFSSLSRERAFLTSIAIVWPLLLLFWLQGVLRDPDFRRQPQLHSELRVADLRRAPDQDLESFIGASRSALASALAEQRSQEDENED